MHWTRERKVTTPKRERAKIRKPFQARVISGPTNMRKNQLPNPTDLSFLVPSNRVESINARLNVVAERQRTGEFPGPRQRAINHLSPTFGPAEELHLVEFLHEAKECQASKRDTVVLCAPPTRREGGLTSHPPSRGSSPHPPVFRGMSLQSALPPSLRIGFQQRARDSTVPQQRQQEVNHGDPANGQRDHEPSPTNLRLPPQPHTRSKSESSTPPNSAMTQAVRSEAVSVDPRSTTHGPSRAPAVDPHAFELYRTFIRTGKLNTCIAPTPRDATDAYT